MALYSGTIVLSLACIVYYLLERRPRRVQSALFAIILIDLVVSAAADLTNLCIQASPDATGSLFAARYFVEMLFWISHTALAPLYAIYALVINGSGIGRKRLFYFFFMLPFAIIELLIFSNPITNVHFFFVDCAVYVRGPSVYISYVVALFYLMTGIFYLLLYSNAIPDGTRRALYIFFSFTLVGIFTQLIFPWLRVELFAEAITAFGVVLTIETEHGYIDEGAVCYNSRAYLRDNKRLLYTRHRYAALSLQFTNLPFYSRVLSANDMNEWIATLIAYLRRLSPGNYVYRLDSSTFAFIVFDVSDRGLDALVDEIASRFGREREFRGHTMDLDLVLSVARAPEDFHTPEMLASVAEASHEMGTSRVRILRGDALSSVRRAADVEIAVARAVSQNSISVLYQPIWSAEKNAIVGAEALARLDDLEVGPISPEVFIDVAERSGHINEIGLYMFEAVCCFIEEHPLEQLGLEFIDVNLSVYQLLASDTVELFTRAMRVHDVKASQINLEITESASFGGSDTVKRRIDELIELGFLFSLDDFGTGYSNLISMTKMNFTNIKSDKGLLWDADNKSSRFLLCDTIKMLRRQSLNVVQEGVETQEQLELVLGVGANYIQGDFFSCALTPSQFVEYVKHFNA